MNPSYIGGRTLMSDPRGQHRIITNSFAFTETFIPPILKVRGDEASKLIGRIAEVLLSGAGFTDMIAIVGTYGRVGIGKTTLGRYVGLKLENMMNKKGVKFKFIYVNVFGSPPQEIIADILSKYIGDSSFLVRRGRGYSFRELLFLFASKVYSDNAYVLVMLDELQGLIRRTPDALEELYMLFRLHETFPHASGPPRVGFIIVGTDVDVLYKLRSLVPQLESMITIREVLYPYNKNHLYEILLQRSSIALRPGSYDDDVLETIAEAFGFDTGRDGSARKAINALKEAALIAEHEHRDYITVEDARRAVSGLAEPWLSESELWNMDLHQLLVLEAIAELSMKDRDLTSDRVQRWYAVLAEAVGEKPRRKTQFYEYLKRFESLGLVKRLKARGRKFVIQLAPDLPAAGLTGMVKRVLEKKYGVMLDGR